MGFPEERRTRGHCAPNRLFLGEQYGATDFSYEDELTGLAS